MSMLRNNQIKRVDDEQTFSCNAKLNNPHYYYTLDFINIFSLTTTYTGKDEQLTHL